MSCTCIQCARHDKQKLKSRLYVRPIACVQSSQQVHSSLNASLTLIASHSSTSFEVRPAKKGLSPQDTTKTQTPGRLLSGSCSMLLHHPYNLLELTQTPSSLHCTLSAYRDTEHPAMGGRNQLVFLVGASVWTTATTVSPCTLSAALLGPDSTLTAPLNIL